MFAEHLHWSMIFWINVPLGLGALALLLPKMARIPVYHRRRKVDWSGGLLLMASALALMLVLSWGGTQFPWASTTILALAGAALLLALAFLVHARRTAQPFLPLPLMGGRVVPWAMAAGGCAMGAMIGLTVHLPLYYEVVYQLSSSAAGLALIPVAAVSVGGAALAGRCMVRFAQYKRVAIAGTGLSALIAGALALATPLPLWALLASLSLFSFGLGTVFPVSLVSIQNAVARGQVGTATGAMTFFRSLMASFTVAAFTAILLAALGAGFSLGGEHRPGAGAAGLAAADMVAAFRYLFAAAAVLLAAAGICVMAMEQRALSGPADPAMPAE